MLNTRIKISALLLGTGLILAFLPYNSSKTFRLKPSELLKKSLSGNIYFSVDQVARFVNNEDSTVQLVDIRNNNEFFSCNIPGSVNIPVNDLLNPEREGYLNQKDVKTVFYGNGEELANAAWTIATGMDYKNCYVMKGGLNEWFKTIMLTNFEGDKISPHENAVFENRFKARKLFTQYNSIPDSLKTIYLVAKRNEQAQLDGGCE